MGQGRKGKEGVNEKSRNNEKGKERGEETG